MRQVKLITVCAMITVSWPGSARAQIPAGSDTLSLVEAVERALSEHPAVGSARARRDGARAARGEASSAWLPTLRVAVSATRYEEPMIVTPIHGFTPGATPPFDRTLLQGSAGLSYVLFDGGARTGRIRRASADLEAASAGVEAAEQMLLARVVGVYLETLSRQGVLEAHDRRVGALEAELARVRQLLDVGRAARIEVLRAEAVLANARAERERALTGRDVARRELARLVGITADAIEARPLKTVQLAGEFRLSARDSIVGAAVRTSPTVQRARRYVAAAEARLGVARSMRWPDIELDGAYVNRGSADGDFTGEWNLGVQLSYPIYTGGRVSRAIDGARASRRAAAQDLRVTELEVADQIDRIVSTIEESRVRIRSLATAVDRSAEVVRIEGLRLEAGAGTQTDYLSAEADLLASRAGLVEARHAEMMALAELAASAGRLSVEWLRVNLEGAQ